MASSQKQPFHDCNEDKAHQGPQGVLERKWYLPETHMGNSDVSSRSYILLRSDGTGRLHLEIDNDDEWGFGFDEFLSNGAFLFHISEMGPRAYWNCDINHRDLDITYSYGSVLPSIATLNVTMWH